MDECGIGVVQIVQDGNCLPPGVLGGVRFGGGFVSIPEAHERLRHLCFDRAGQRDVDRVVIAL
jgi:hypothetical protein